MIRPRVRLGDMNAVKKAPQAVDRFQQRRSWLVYVIGAWKKFGDDQDGSVRI
jgi:hypothetical protein